MTRDSACESACESAGDTVWIGLGANVGDTHAALRWAVQAMRQLPSTRVLRVSSVYRSAPVDASGPDYLNAVAALHTTLTPATLWHALQDMEHAAGRQRPYRNAPRTLDLDVLLWGDTCIHTPDLTVPHPRLYERAFVLLPLHELCPERVSAQHLHAVAAQRIERIGRIENVLPILNGAVFVQLRCEGIGKKGVCG